MTIPQNVSELLELYCKELSTISLRYLKSTLRRYIFPFLEGSQIFSLTLDWREINRQLEKISIAEFVSKNPEAILNAQLAIKVQRGTITRQTAN